MFKRLAVLPLTLFALLGFNLSPASAVDCSDPGPYMALTGCSFQNLDLSEVDLTGSDLSGVNLTGTNLESAILDGVTSGRITGTPSNLPAGWQLLSGYLVGPGANLTNADFTNQNLTNANLVGANLSNAIFSGTTLTGADFAEATLTNVAGRSIVGLPVNLPSPWRLSHGLLIGPTANLTGLDLSAIDLNQFDFTAANLSGSLFCGVDLTDVDFTSTNVMNITFINCNLTRTDFTGLDVEGIRAVGISGTPRGLPSNFKIINGFAIGPYANLSSLNLMNINFAGTNLHHASLAGANLSGANLANVDLTLTQFTDVNLSRANITNTNLTGVDLSGVISSGLIGTPVGLTDEWQLYQGYLFGPKANLSSVDFSNKDLRDAHLKGVFFIGANLSGADLSGVDLSNTNLTGVLLSGTDLTDTNLTNATLTGIFANNIIGAPIGLPSSWRLLNEYLIGPGANLNNADLSGLDLAGIDLTGASLLVTDFSGANLEGANLTDAAINNANFTDATLTNVISTSVKGVPVGLPTNVQLLGGKFLGVFVKSPIPKISGQFTAGKILTAVPGSWDEGVAISYQWLRNGNPIAQANSATYTLTGADAQAQISVAVTGTATGGVTRTKTSTAFKVALGIIKPGAVSISGKIIGGKPVSAKVSSWIYGAVISYSWLLDGKAIKGQSKATFKIPVNARGHKVSLVVKQSAKGFKPSTVTSKQYIVK
jgi:uncharacterized protein YjbI with pentapeptide repeats